MGNFFFFLLYRKHLCVCKHSITKIHFPSRDFFVFVFSSLRFDAWINEQTKSKSEFSCQTDPHVSVKTLDLMNNKLVLTFVRNVFQNVVIKGQQMKVFHTQVH